MTSTVKPLTYGECSDNEMYIQEVDNPDIQVAYVLNYGDFNKTLALAQLFAAAPELLEALDTLTAVIGLTPIAGNKPAVQEAFDIARAAIEKARGER
ncbi:hypothetical protein UFOVP835_10 [uncultured Caudovirales phage]|uniref:Uncharacterized protein n=1 Tax=uncultured Caudovirales phage TaxID=2100421 RepID=A0A6J5P2F2_9CAUD|nr:hypothetical protein UFOVP835_10 [uncultured Caudovirales phage]